MPLGHLCLENFRNVRRLELLPHPQLNFFYGENAQGKTSILEAIYFLSELKSFRTSDVETLILKSADRSFLSATVDQEGICHDLKILLEHQKKQIHLNGKTPKPYRKVKKIFPVTLFTPDSVRLFRTTPSERRHYFDHHFSTLSEEYFELIHDYQHVLKQKSEWLDQCFESKNKPDFLNQSPLDVWNDSLAKLGARVTFLRLKATDRLNTFFKNHFSDLSFALWEATLCYEPYLKALEGCLDPLEIERILRKTMEDRREEEMRRNQVLVGPHRDDWAVHLKEGLLKQEGSQGQHRVAVAALKLAEADQLACHGFKVTALFDDLLSELDFKRASQMLFALKKTVSQIFLTSVTPSEILLEKMEGDALQVKEGMVFRG